MFHRICATLLLLLLHGCPNPGSGQSAPLKYRAVGNSPEVLAVYEAWFGHPAHISVKYNSHDPTAVKRSAVHRKGLPCLLFSRNLQMRSALRISLTTPGHSPGAANTRWSASTTEEIGRAHV